MYVYNSGAKIFFPTDDEIKMLRGNEIFFVGLLIPLHLYLAYLLEYLVMRKKERFFFFHLLF